MFDRIFEVYWKSRKTIVGAFILISVISALALPNIKFSFDFNQFFPEGDEDLIFFQKFIKEFEADDNFLLVAVENNPSVFDSSFLAKFHDFCIQARDLPYILEVQSLTKIQYPLKTPFGVSAVPVIHRDNPSFYEADRENILSDPRFLHNLINKDADALVVFMKVKDAIDIDESEKLTAELHKMLAQFSFQDSHILGRANFQSEIVKMQKIEILQSSIVSVLLVMFIMILIYRRWKGVAIALGTIGLSLLIFMGTLSILGEELTIMAALYPVLILIVGTSDVIHIMSKYIDELSKGKAKKDAMYTTIKEIGFATLLTSVTTAIGFASLLTSRLAPIRDFGINAAGGVMIAFLTVVFLTTALLSFFDKNDIADLRQNDIRWNGWMNSLYQIILTKKNRIYVISLITLGICLWGITKVSTNYKIESNLPRGAKVTQDFKFFEEKFAGFRPLEFAITVKNGKPADDYEVVKEINKLEEHLLSIPQINSVISQASLYKSIERMNRGNQRSGYQFPDTQEEFEASRRMLNRLKLTEANILINKSNDKTRISSRIADIGADSIKQLGIELDAWVEANIDTSLLDIRRTGTGLIIDKNSIYVTESLVEGLGIALILISILMGLLLRSWSMLFIALIPNLLPLLFAGGLLGFLGIDLEAGVSIIFAVIFGIAVDDTIHFLSKYKLCRVRGESVDDAIHTTFKETGKAIIFTTVILFFGFLIMLFSKQQASFTVGTMISVTLVAALICDLFLLPVLMRKFLK